MSAQEAKNAAAAESEQPIEQAAVSNAGESATDDKAHAEVAAQVADSAEKLDGTPMPA